MRCLLTALTARCVRSARDSGGSARDTAESGTARGDGFAAFMRSQHRRVDSASDPADARRQLSAEWLQLTVADRREWRRRDAASLHEEAGRASLGSTGGGSFSSRAGSSTPPRASRRKSPATRSSRTKHVRTTAPIQIHPHARSALLLRHSDYTISHPLQPYYPRVKTVTNPHFSASPLPRFPCSLLSEASRTVCLLARRLAFGLLIPIRRDPRDARRPRSQP